jgi:simple sugar transport system permease protein
MLNYTILHISNHLVRYVLTNDADATPKISANASLRADFLTQMTGGSRLNLGIFLAILMIFVVWVLMNRTTVGFELRSVGLNPDASEYAGMNAKKNIVLAMLISGGLAGMGGVIEGLGTFENLYVLGGVPTIGFDGMAVSLLGGGIWSSKNWWIKYAWWSWSSKRNCRNCNCVNYLLYWYQLRN